MNLLVLYSACCIRSVYECEEKCCYAVHVCVYMEYIISIENGFVTAYMPNCDSTGSVINWLPPGWRERDGRAATMCTTTCKSTSGSCRKPREKTSEWDRVNFCSLIYRHIRVFFGHNLKQADRQGDLALSLIEKPGRENKTCFFPFIHMFRGEERRNWKGWWLQSFITLQILAFAKNFWCFSWQYAYLLP